MHPIEKLSGKDSDWPNLGHVSVCSQGWGIMIDSPLPPLQVGKEWLVAQEGEEQGGARQMVEAIALHHSRGSSVGFFDFVDYK